MSSTTTIQEILNAIISQNNDHYPSEYDCLSITCNLNWDGLLSDGGFCVTQIADAVSAYYSECVCPVKEVSMALEHFDAAKGSCRLRIDLKFTRTPGTRYVAYPFLPFTEQSEIRYHS